MTAKEMAQAEFDTLPFRGYYGDLLAQPERNFWMLVYGPPWQGKTSFCVGFAKYLSENFGNVLYVSTEQYNSESIKQVIQRVKADKLNQLHFTPSLEKAPPLENYDFIFIDSATANGIDFADVMRLRESRPGCAFIVVLQSIKSGDFHGKQGWRHMPDIVVKVRDGQAAIEKNRYSDKPVVMDLPKAEENKEVKKYRNAPPN
ncbi:MAG: hypothetical protein AB1458_12005 [Bacteroidota bacterium]